MLELADNLKQGIPDTTVAVASSAMKFPMLVFGLIATILCTIFASNLVYKHCTRKGFNWSRWFQSFFR